MRWTVPAGVVALLLVSSLSTAERRNLFPSYPNGGNPDLAIDGGRVRSSLDIVEATFSSSSCALSEGSIGGTGVRRLLRFDVALVNGGDEDLVVGNPVTGPYASSFQYSPCHGHYHLQGFTDYQLLDLNRQPAGTGHKQAFCLEDVLKYGTNQSNGYTCSYQGITVGWADLYSKSLSGQWVDITDVPDGEYILHVEINAAGTFGEGQNLYPNVYETNVVLPLPRGRGRR